MNEVSEAARALGRIKTAKKAAASAGNLEAARQVLKNDPEAKQRKSDAVRAGQQRRWAAYHSAKVQEDQP